MSVQITEAAIHAARQLQQDHPEWSALSLRLYLEGKGCSGFEYGVTFDQKSAEDHAFVHDGIELIIDPQTLLYVHGSTVEWVDDERGRGFLVENPNHKKFRGKFYKREGWQDKLRTQLDANTPSGTATLSP